MPVICEPLLIRAKDAAALCGVSPRKWGDLQASGQIPPSFKLGGCRVWRVSDLKKWVAWGMPNLDRFEALASGGEQ